MKVLIAIKKRKIRWERKSDEAKFKRLLDRTYKARKLQKE